ncbi:alpha/beta hydrolase [Halobacteriales archaeon QS_8_69_26]|nr:MAG: alpha/beta hydrolase [Halobacteriales archaeon QS_8_69_26]
MERDPDRPGATDDPDPGVRTAVRRAREAGVPPWRALSVSSARRIEDELFGAGGGPGMALVRDLAIDGPGGDLPVRIYRPERPSGGDGDEPSATGDLPVLVFYHGGGWVLGTLDSADDLCRHLADRVGALVVSVDYRLAPEHPFPAAVEDAGAALAWAAEYAGHLGGDPDRIAVAGTSAGGGLAAATAARADDLGVDLAAQALLYPMLDRDTDTPSAREHADAPLLSLADVRWFWDLYLRSPVDVHNPVAVPATAPTERLSGAPPAVVVTAGHDVLRDEAADYAGLLREAGVGVDHRHFPSMVHGFLSMTDDSDRADRAMGSVRAAIRELLS